MIKNIELRSSSLWEDSLAIYQKILELPFIEELTTGSLPSQKFAYYMQQDALYLVDFARALSLIAAKTSDASAIISFIKFAELAIIGERELHQFYFNYYGVNPHNEKNDACFMYTHYLISTVATQSLEESVAAVLPCLWIYRDVGNYIYERSSSQNPYWKWIETYSNQNYSQVVEDALIIAERMYERSSVHTQKVMKKSGLQSAILEWRFWDDAYKLEPSA